MGRVGARSKHGASRFDRGVMRRESKVHAGMVDDRPIADLSRVSVEFWEGGDG